MKYKKALKEYFERGCDYCTKDFPCPDCEKLTEKVLNHKKTKLCPECESALQEDDTTFFDPRLRCRNCEVYYSSIWVDGYWKGWNKRNDT